VQAGEVIAFPQGLIGCEKWRHFVLEANPPGDPILTLRCLDQPGIAFWVTDPFSIVSDYEVQISDAEGMSIGLKDLSDALVLCILTVRPPPMGVTANLLGPLVINVRERLGRQLVLSDSKYSVRHQVRPEGA
jgi:flagellar assembly factor FliW